MIEEAYLPLSILALFIFLFVAYGMIISAIEDKELKPHELAAKRAGKYPYRDGPPKPESRQR